jgi:hypothetical protein
MSEAGINPRAKEQIKAVRMPFISVLNFASSKPTGNGFKLN